MRGSYADRIFRGLSVVAVVTAVCIGTGEESNHAWSAEPTRVPRSEMVAVAKQLAEHRWVCKPANRKAPCSTQYRSRFKDNEEVTGVAYDWGGMDSPKVFDERLRKRQAAGSRQEEGVTSCTAGVDCSGLLSLAWGQKKKYGTRTIHEIAADVTLDRQKDLKPGDALNKAGSHIVMFLSYHPDGTISVYESAGTASRVVLTRSTWGRYQGYLPVRYAGVVD